MYTIIVTGTRLKINKDSNGGGWLSYLEAGYDGEPNPTLSPEPDGSGGPYEEMPAALETPCVTASPEGHSLAEINNVALVASNEIAALEDDRYEYGVFIYELDGRIYFTAPFTQNSEEDIDWNGGVASIPAGAHILAIVHNHPNKDGIDDRLPSRTNVMTGEEGRDWASYDAIKNWSGSSRGITVDPNMLMYVYTNQDKATHVYDKNDRNTTRASCTLQEPIPGATE